jgi:hypothetical protein
VKSPYSLTQVVEMQEICLRRSWRSGLMLHSFVTRISTKAGSPQEMFARLLTQTAFTLTTALLVKSPQKLTASVPMSLFVKRRALPQPLKNRAGASWHRGMLRNKRRGRNNAHLVGDFSYHDLVTTGGLFTPKGHCVEVVQGAL